MPCVSPPESDDAVKDSDMYSSSDHSGSTKKGRIPKTKSGDHMLVAQSYSRMVESVNA